jgi:glycosyltransferase involved in cell wall biosynthesis
VKPLVSVIVPFLDEERYLGQALGSVLAQTLDAWEVLLVDDGSTDASVEIAASFTEAHADRARLLRHPGGRRRGPAAARNLGITEARGAYLAFLDADDLFAPEKLARKSALLEGMDAAMLYGPTRWSYEGSSRRDEVEWPGVPAGRVYPPPELLRRILLSQEGHIPCTCGVLIRREAALSVGGFEEGFRLYEDQSLWAKLFLRFPVYVSPLCQARYRQHEASSSSAAQRAGEYHPTRPHPAGLAFLEWLQGYVREAGRAEPEMMRAFRWAFYPYRHPRQARAFSAARRLRFAVRRWWSGHSRKMDTDGKG